MKFCTFRIPIEPVHDMSLILNDPFKSSTTKFFVELTDEEVIQVEKEGFLYLSPKKRNNSQNKNEKILLIEEKLKFKIDNDEKTFIFDLIDEYKNLSSETKKIIKEVMSNKNVSTHLLSFAIKNNFELNISPVKFSCAMVNQEKQLTNLGLKRLKGDYLGGIAFLTEDEVKDYKKHLLPAYFKWLETKTISSRKIKVKKKNPHINNYKENSEFSLRTGKYESYYFNKQEGFLFDENTGYCKRHISKIKDGLFDVKIFYKTGELKMQFIHQTFKDSYKENAVLSGLRDHSFIYADKGIGIILYSLDKKLKTTTYYGLSSNFKELDLFSDYTKSFNSFFLKIEKNFNIKLSKEKKEYIVSLFYHQRIINIVNIEKTIRENAGILMSDYLSIDDYIDSVELFFTA